MIFWDSGTSSGADIQSTETQNKKNATRYKSTKSIRCLFE
jgi:hypothetical protein